MPNHFGKDLSSHKQNIRSSLFIALGSVRTSNVSLAKINRHRNCGKVVAKKNDKKNCYKIFVNVSVFVLQALQKAECVCRITNL